MSSNLLRHRKWILEGKTPVPCEDTIAWGLWFEKADRVVAQTQVGCRFVSTVFLGIDHQRSSEPDARVLLFETMVFGCDVNELNELTVHTDRELGLWHNATWEEAEATHWAMVGSMNH